MPISCQFFPLLLLQFLSSINSSPTCSSSYFLVKRIGLIIRFCLLIDSYEAILTLSNLNNNLMLRYFDASMLVFNTFRIAVFVKIQYCVIATPFYWSNIALLSKVKIHLKNKIWECGISRSCLVFRWVNNNSLCFEQQSWGNLGKFGKTEDCASVTPSIHSQTELEVSFCFLNWKFISVVIFVDTNQKNMIS